MKVFLSVPMNGRKDEDIQFTIDKMKSVISVMFTNEVIEFIDNFHCEFNKINSVSENEKRLYYLGEAIKKIGECDTFAFLDIRDMWELRSTGCYIEHEVATRYDMKMLPLVDYTGWIFVPDLRKKHEELMEEQKRRIVGVGYSTINDRVESVEDYE